MKSNEPTKREMRHPVNDLHVLEVERNAAAEGKPFSYLTRREREVYPLLSKSNKEIASALGIEVRTVRFHVENILRKFGVASRIEILAKDWPERQ
jgi:DNA-binding NarL/FixJ family response regulator